MTALVPILVPFLALTLLTVAAGAGSLECAGAFTAGAQVKAGQAAVRKFSRSQGRTNIGDEKVSATVLKTSAARDPKLLAQAQIIRIESKTLGRIEIALPQMMTLQPQHRVLESWSKKTAAGVEESVASISIDGFNITYKIETLIGATRHTRTVNLVNEGWTTDSVVELRVIRIAHREQTGEDVTTTSADISGLPVLRLRATLGANLHQ